MNIRVHLKNPITEYSVMLNLPVTWKIIERAYRDIGIPIEQYPNWRKDTSDIPCEMLTDCDMVYATIDCSFDDIICNEKNLIMINLIAIAFDNLDRHEEEAVNLYQGAEGNICNALELINACLDVENIYYYSYECDNGSNLYCLGYTLGYNQCPEEFQDYVDWDEYGSDMSNDYTYGDCGYVYSYEPGDPNLNYYSFEEICKELSWPIEEIKYDKPKFDRSKYIINPIALEDFIGGVNHVEIDSGTVQRISV